MRRNPILMTVMGANPPVRIPGDLEAVLHAVMRWPGNWSARPYAEALLRGDTGFDDPKGVLLYLKSNLRTWKGTEARIAKQVIDKYIKQGLRGFANPGARCNPHIVIDSENNEVRWISRGHPIRTFDDALGRATLAARRMGRNMHIVAHPSVPSWMKIGVQVSPVFLAMGPYVSVTPAGDVIRSNPSVGASIAGGIAGALVGRALSNPLTHDETEDVLYKRGGYTKEMAEWPVRSSRRAYWEGRRDEAGDIASRYGAQGIAANPAKLLTKADISKLPPLYSQEKVSDPVARVKFFTPWTNWTWYATEFDGQDTFFGLVQGHEEELGYFSLSELQSIRGPGGLRVERDLWFRPTPLSQLRRRMLTNPRVKRSRGRYVRERQKSPGAFDPRSFRTVKVGGHRVVIGCPRGHWDVRRKRCRVGTRAQTVLHPMRRKNPGKYTIGRGPTEVGISSATARRIMTNPRKRRVTMPIRRFAELVRRRRDPALWRAFLKRVQDYKKWTHGSMPTKVTVEAVDAPGVSGLWMTYDLGRTPETTYVMPKNSKRKGAWKHPWGRMPHMKGDPQSGIILTKLASGNRLTDFMHG